MIEVNPGQTDVSTAVFIQDSTATDGAGLTGLTKATAGLTCYYYRPGSSATAVALSDIFASDAHMDGGLAEVDATNMPGVYRLDLPDAVSAVGVSVAYVYLQGAADMVPCPETIILRKTDKASSDIDVVQSDMLIFKTQIVSDVVLVRSDAVTVQSDLAVVKTQLGSDMTTVKSDATVFKGSLASDLVLGRSDTVVVQSDLLVAKNKIVSDIVLARSDAVTIQSDLLVAKNKIVSDGVLVRSDVVTVQSDLDYVVPTSLTSDLTVIRSDLAYDAGRIISDAETTQSDVALINTGSIGSDVIVIQSDLALLGAKVVSDLVLGRSDTVVVQSDLAYDFSGLFQQNVTIRHTVTTPRISGASS